MLVHPSDKGVKPQKSNKSHLTHPTIYHPPLLLYISITHSTISHTHLLTPILLPPSHITHNPPTPFQHHQSHPQHTHSQQLTTTSHPTNHPIIPTHTPDNSTTHSFPTTYHHPTNKKRGLPAPHTSHITISQHHT